MCWNAGHYSAVLPAVPRSYRGTFQHGGSTQADCHCCCLSVRGGSRGGAALGLGTIRRYEHSIGTHFSRTSDICFDKPGHDQCSTSLLYQVRACETSKSVPLFAICNSMSKCYFSSSFSDHHDTKTSDVNTRDNSRGATAIYYPSTFDLTFYLFITVLLTVMTYISTSRRVESLNEFQF